MSQVIATCSCRDCHKTRDASS